jgi:glucan phosphorylase
MSLSITLQICAVLYPGDATEEGKLLRLKQQFFLCSASLQVVKQFISLEQGSNKRNQGMYAHLVLFYMFGNDL